MLLILLAGAVAARAAAESLADVPTAEGLTDVPLAKGLADVSAAEGLADVPMADYVRLHVIASDDGEAAQALKLKVRDAVLEEARVLLADCADAETAWAIVNDNLDALTAAARGAAAAEGYGGPVAAQTGRFDFPDRRYGDVLVPAGRYRALRVVIGAGEGRNWWCVLYPTMCLTENCVPGEPVVFHSVILDWLAGLFGGEGA